MLLGNVEHQKAERPRLLEQRAHEARRLRLDRVHLRQDIAADEALGDVGNRGVVARQVLVSEDVANRGADEEAAPGEGAVLDHGATSQQRTCHRVARRRESNH